MKKKKELEAEASENNLGEGLIKLPPKGPERIEFLKDRVEYLGIEKLRRAGEGAYRDFEQLKDDAKGD